ncbi:MAG TPA: hypothetical protein DCY14_07145 [Anaerolineae bacterium]|nr:hypothetical protein [Anaerolineae bacterium]HRJ55297.1 DUF2812 domain-containing protein [Anaerolineales bacterium]
MTTLKQFHWFWAWDDDKEEAWLRKMAQKGWHFKLVKLPGYYSFEQGEPRNDFYRLDFFIDSKAKADYVQLFLDAGWEYLGEMGSWQYFRKTALENETLEIYSDNESKSKKYQRILFFLVVFLPIYINSINILNKRQDTLSLILTFVMFAFMLLYGYSIIRLGMRVNQLKKKL